MDTQEKTQEVEKPKTTEIVVRNSDGKTFSTRLKDAKGQFIRKEKTMPNSRELTRRGRTLLYKKVKILKEDPEGKLVETGETGSQFDLMVQFMIDASMGKISGDPKMIMAATQAFKVVTGRLLGKEPLSDEDREAQKDSNVIRFVLVQPPPELNSKPSKEEIKQPLKPAFIDAEVVSQN